jgi:raffinose/stachyose/melibiose transport system permease protein
VFADLVMTASPVLIVYILAQRYIIEGMTAGAIKG